MDDEERTSKSDDQDDSDAEVEVAKVHDQPEEGNPRSTHFVSPTLSSPTQIYRPSNPLDTLPQAIASQSWTLLPPSSWRLLDVYFAYTQSWLPICEKHRVFRTFHSYPDSVMTLSIADLPDSGDCSELWSILTVASHQYYDEADGLLDPEKLYSTTRSLIPTDSELCGLGHVKALLNLAMVNIGRGQFETAWLLVGAATRILKVIEHSSSTPIPRSKHLLASCFLLDASLSLQLGGKQVHRSDTERAEEDGLEEWQPWVQPSHSPSAAPYRPRFWA
jgi:hypothetical protein